MILVIRESGGVMNKNRMMYRWCGLLAAVSALAIAVSGCSGSDGSAGAPGAPGATVGVKSPADATSLSMTITSVTVGSPPVVNFTVTDQNGVPVVGFTDTDLRFNIAKLTPGTDGNPGTWQNYIVTGNNGAMQGAQERKTTSPGIKWGTLVDNKNGTYTYTFATDITSATANPCPSPCTDVDGNPLDISYQPTLTTRVGIQMSNSAYPKVNATYDFVPAGGAVSTQRDIVQTSNCNECHNQLAVHGGTRIETKLCVTCHNPGSWVAAGSNATTTWVKETVDFKHMIHKIHQGDDLPSVLGPDGLHNTADDGKYTIRTSDFSDVHFPQDVRNCTKCHTNTDTNVARNTPQGDNWETHPSIAACGSCHDDVNFGNDSSKPVLHPGGDVSAVDSSTCLLCHKSGGPGLSVADAHSFPAKLKAESAKYKLNIVSVSASQTPTIKFSVTNPANNNAAYDIANTPAITSGSLSLIIGWKTPEPSGVSAIDPIDFNNSGRSNAQPISINLLSGGALSGSVSNNGDGTYSVTSGTAIPLDAIASSGRVGFYARMAVDVDGNGTADRVPVTSAVKDFAISGTAVLARRSVVDIAKCDKCHSQLSLHGSARTDQPQLCVMCHNPDATDTAQRPAGAPTGTVDNLKEQAIDFKRLVHGVHGAEKRVNPFVVYGFNGSVNDFSHVRFPGILKDCTTCHTTSSYQLTGPWESPTQSGILASTVDHGTSLTDPIDDMNFSPTAAACTSCHDDPTDPKLQHVEPWGFGKFQNPDTQAAINNSPEICVTCHGPGGIVDVKTAHGVK